MLTTTTSQSPDWPSLTAVNHQPSLQTLWEVGGLRPKRCGAVITDEGTDVALATGSAVLGWLLVGSVGMVMVMVGWLTAIPKQKWDRIPNNHEDLTAGSLSGWLVVILEGVACSKCGCKTQGCLVFQTKSHNILPSMVVSMYVWICIIMHAAYT